ncbi:hypothetical protein A2Y85_01890 [candidate division WOR-3 bacterium RBG_13_43_14]|uniref:FlgD/Vpr Ig-like domain-containing protein n=1 Tax=candidate division WOR-3 bacterium RBG_13_43_14 TaxID=1802590 RepID=A0A1F4UF29_UNCW3|nr:MAG: hypothetical protein A2Y85_01890 [candidate division WOR-3 bacterium RBG_13_43_14]
MHRIFYLALSFIVACGFIYALTYIESSVGLETPAMEAGRTELELVDINQDGNIDILSIGDHGSPYVNTQEHGVMVWFGNGQGTWSVYQNGNFGYGGIAIGDLNNDGDLDIGYGMHHNYSSTDFGDSILEAALGDGSGQNWIAWDDGISIGDASPWGMFCTDFADIDNDGYLDLGSNAFGADDGVHLFLNNGDGTWQPCFGFLGGNSTMNFLFGDINADGNVDFCAAHQYGSIYLGDGQGGFTLADGNLPPGSNVGRRGPALGDVDNDGDQDFSFTNTSGGVEVWVWQGSNTWSNFSGSLPANGPYYGSQLCDMNIDGYMDLVAFGDSTVTVWLGNGAGAWTHNTSFYTPGPGDYSALRVSADADHNGFIDIALVDEDGDGWNAINHLRFYKENSIPGSLFVFPVFPRGGEKFYAGSVHFINWTCGVPVGNIAMIKLELSTNGPAGPWTLITGTTPNNGRYQWAISSSCPASTNCYVRYTATTASDTAVAITPASFTVLPIVHVAEKASQNTEPVNALQIAPVPFKELLWINVKTGSSAKSSVDIYDNTGRLIRHLLTINGRGFFRAYWDGKDNNGNEMPGGAYIICLESGDSRSIEKIIKLK